MECDVCDVDSSTLFTFDVDDVDVYSQCSSSSPARFTISNDEKNPSQIKPHLQSQQLRQAEQQSVQSPQLPKKLNDPLISDQTDYQKTPFQLFHDRLRQTYSNTLNPNQNQYNNLNHEQQFSNGNQQQLPSNKFDLHANSFQFQDQQLQLTSKPVCALIVIGILLIVLNYLIQGISNRAPMVRPDVPVGLNVFVQLINAGLETCKCLCIYIISNNNLVFLFFDLLCLFFCRSWNESKNVKVLQASLSFKPVWRFLLLGID